MPSCAVATCQNTQRTKTSRISNVKPCFHRFPQGEISKKWEVLCKRADPINLKRAVICSDHFLESDYERDLKAELLGLSVSRKLKKGIVPTLNLPTSKPPVQNSTNRDIRITNRKRKRLVSELLEASTPAVQEAEVPEPCPVTAESCPENNTDTPENNSDQSWKNKYLHQKMKCRRLESQLRLLNFEVSKLKQRHSRNLVGNRKFIRRIQMQLSKAQEEMAKKDKVLSSLFSPEQLRRLEGESVCWTLADVRKCMAIMTISKKAYKILRQTWKLPLPSERTLQRWLHRYKITPGIITPVMQLLKELSTGMTLMEKICILSFDEISMTAEADWDKSTDTVYGPHSKAQVAMLSGICTSWRQPIFYAFDEKMSRKLLFRILRAVKKSGFNLKAVVCDLGGTNQELLNELNIAPDRSSFMYKNSRVHVFADIPHMLKLLRNHLIDTGWVVNGTIINKKIVETMIIRDNGEVRLCPKLTFSSINCTGAERMKVAPAAHLFSTHTATLAQLIFPENPEISCFFQQIDDLFDIFNSRVPEDFDKAIRSGFGLKFRQQMELLDKLKCTIGNVRCLFGKANNLKKRNSMLPCQRGVLISINSLKSLYDDLNCNFGVTYILTRRLNQDSLESLFSVIRSLGRTNDNPLPSSFNNRMKILLFGSKLKPPPSSNVEFLEDHVSFTTSRLMEIATAEVRNLDTVMDDPHDEADESLLDYGQNGAVPIVEFGEDALHYLAGYIAMALKRKHGVILGEITRSSDVFDVGFDWIRRLSRGGLMIPCESLFRDITLCEKYFIDSFPMEKLTSRPNISQIIRVALKDAYPSIDENVIAEFVKVRIKIRIKYVNDERKTKKFVRYKSRKNLRKSKQFVKSSV